VRRGSTRQVITLVAALVALKVAALLVDPTVRVYLGDSIAYLYGATDSGRLPDDRSFTYSLLIRGLVRPFDTLRALVWWQTLAGVLIALIAWHVLRSRLCVHNSIATVGACLLAIEPAQLYYERMVLAETFGLLACMLFYAMAAAYVANARVWWLPFAALAGLLAVTLRLNYLPVVLVISMALPLVRWLISPRPAPLRVLGHTAVAVLSVAALHVGFQQWVAFIFKAPPGYIGRAGFMQLGLVLPLVTPDQLVQVGLPRDFEEQLQYPLNDPDARMRHMWSAGGFIRTLRERGVPIEAVARPLASMAVAADPLGLVRMGLHTMGNYFREEGILTALDNDLGQRVIPDEVLWTLREIWHYNAEGLWRRTTAVSWYFRYGTWLLVACLFALAPLVVLNAWRRRTSPVMAQTVLLALFGIGLVLAHILFVPVAFYRYLHPLPVFVMIAACSLVASSSRSTHRSVLKSAHRRNLRTRRTCVIRAM
jgi:hypothetical protein